MKNFDASESEIADAGRRHLLQHGATAAGLVLLGSGLAGTSAAATATAEGPSTLERRAFHTAHQPVPLAFDAAKLSGLSERLIQSHWANNYGGSVRALNQVNQRLSDALDTPDLPAFIYNDLKREHLIRTGSVVLHELYFGNLGGNGRAPTALRTRIGDAFGSFDRWETEFRRMAAGLGGGSGWVMLGWNRHLGALENYWMADHAHGPTVVEPLLVLDMYEHSYHMDFGAAANRYVDAFMVNVDWQAVQARLG